MRKQLKELMCGLEIIACNFDLALEVERLNIKSYELCNNSLFIALKGKQNGEDYTSEAMKNGAVAVVSEAFLSHCPCIQVKDSRKALAVISANFYNSVHKMLHIIGVVGTNGKTSVTHIIDAILKKNGEKTAVIGTLGVKIGDVMLDSGLTTPDPIQLHEYLNIAFYNEVKYVVMEISAHAIHFEKLYGIKTDICIFTNLSRDHLDFFPSMEAYAKTKRSYFQEENTHFAIINGDDILGREILRENKVCAVSYGLFSPCDIFAVDIVYRQGRTEFVANVMDEIFSVDTTLLGEFNVYNTLAAIATAKAIGVPIGVILAALMEIPPIEGRFNIINSDITVIIDYAHTPDGLENILGSARKLTDKRLISVFGCGGDRDKGKRPIMGEISARLADVSIFTSDNPRMENPDAIISAIAQGVKGEAEVYLEVKREQAVEMAVKMAKAGDVIVIAGKGGENYIDEMGTKRPYSDSQTAMNAIRRYRRD